MPLNFLATVYVEGRQAIPYYDQAKYVVPALGAAVAVKSFFAGPRNTWGRNMHGRVVLITGGTSGLGAFTAREMAAAGAQVVLLVRSLKDGWLAEYIDDLRESTNNPLVFAEECDLADLYSVRSFATKWIDNVPPRRLDAIVCCAAVAEPPGTPQKTTIDGLEPQFQVNYLAHYLLLTVMQPALRGQPADREVRVVLTSCISALMGDFNLADLGFSARKYPTNAPWRVFGESKLYLSLLGYELQRQFDTYERKDGAPPNVHVTIVDPGMMRSPSFKRFITLGRLSLLLLYVLLWPLMWLFLKSSVDGGQSILYALMSPEIEKSVSASYISQTGIRKAPPRSEYGNTEKQQQLFEATGKLLEATEKSSAIERNKLKEQSEKSKKSKKSKAKAKA